MPRIRLTYQRDIDREGTDTLDVDAARAQAMVKLRRAVLIPDDAAPAPRAKKTTAKKTSSGRKAR